MSKYVKYLYCVWEAVQFRPETLEMIVNILLSVHMAYCSKHIWLACHLCHQCHSLLRPHVSRLYVVVDSNVGS